MRNNISSYAQMESKTLYDSQEKFKDLLKRCPHHGLPIWLQVQTFYNKLNHATRQMINAIVRGTLNNKIPKAAQQLFEEIAMNNYQQHSSKAKSNKPTHVYKMDAMTTLTIQVEALSKKIDGLSIIK